MRVGKYVLEDLLYYGTNCQVWRGSADMRCYCIKIVKGREVEAALLKKIRHDNIVMLYDSFVWEEFNVLVTNFCEGETLEQYVKRGEVMGMLQIQSIVLQLCEVLEYLHGKNKPIYYLDLKESNIMIDRLGGITLVDFGSAIEVGGSAQMILTGTSWYMPPEYRNEGKFGSYTDCFSLGRVIEKLSHLDKESSKAWAGVIKGCTRISTTKRWDVQAIKKAALKCNRYT